LGIGLGLAPIGAYLAVTNEFNIIPVLYGITVIFWVGGFDIIYALQDSSFDRENKLYSIPSKFGIDNAIQISMIFHMISAICLIYAGYLAYNKIENLGILFILANLLFIALLVFQHSIVRKKDMSKINLAFFTTNGIASVLFGTLYIIDLIN
jgi:4-hydroxybenzoate polyprenyltransferase